MDVHFWDMDGTLVNGDVDISWKRYLTDKGLAPPDAQAQADLFYEQYCRGDLDQLAFSRFQYAEFVGRDQAQMAELSRDHFNTCIRDRLYPKAVRWIRTQQSEGRQVVLLTATSRELAQPIADHLGITDVLATNLELIHGRYTGKLTGIYCGGVGKVSYIRPYIETRGVSIDEVYYYGDSVVDVPVLEAVGHPIVCNPGEPLRKIALSNDWPIYDFSS